jgi:HIRAN domain
MENWIERTVEPRQLILAWQAPDYISSDRFRWAVGILEPHGNDYRFRYLRAGPEFESLNPRRPYDDLLQAGYQGYPAFNLRREIHERGLSPFVRRLPSRKRSDFKDYERQFRLGHNLVLSDFGLLGRTEAKLPGDGFSLVDPLNPELDWCDLMLEIAGFRHHVRPEQLKDLNVGQGVEIAPEPDNAKDPNAVRFLLSGRTIGYVNRLQAKTFLRWLAERKVSGVLERINGGEERPRAFVFVRVRPSEAQAAA